jgi:hypothetical protein
VRHTERPGLHRPARKLLLDPFLIGYLLIRHRKTEGGLQGSRLGSGLQAHAEKQDRTRFQPLAPFSKGHRFPLVCGRLNPQGK